MGLLEKFSKILKNNRNEDFLDNLEVTLFESGLSPKICVEVLDALKSSSFKTADQITSKLTQIVSPWIKEYPLPFVSLVNGVCSLEKKTSENNMKVCFFVGVNGVGKTTSIAKLAHLLVHTYNVTNRDITLVAGDTFRAAAAEQLEKHAHTVGTDFIRQKNGADPAAVVFDGITHAQSNKHSVVLADTAGRMNTRKDLILQLQKIHRIALKSVAPENILTFIVLDGNNGLVSLNQVRDFQEAIPLSAFIFTKYDGSTRGGIIISVTKELALPCAFLGTGETLSDLKPFKRDVFLDDFLSI